MVLTQQQKLPAKFKYRPVKIKVQLEAGKQTTLYVIKYPRSEIKPRLVLFDKETLLPRWCQENGISEASGAGFFIRPLKKPRGDLWINGVQQKTVPSISPWNLKRGSLHIKPNGDIDIASRYMLPQKTNADLLEAGPLLVQNGQVVAIDGIDSEGYRESFLKKQNDTDITDGRYPRQAIGVNSKYIFSVACDGYGKGEAGLTMQEFATVLANLGITDALNLDGGSSATLISGGKLINRPIGGRHDNNVPFPEGRPIFSAIVYEPIKSTSL